MKRYLLIGAGIIVLLFVSANITSALSPSLAEAIQGLPFGDQLSLMAQKVDDNTAKIDSNTSKTQQLEQELTTTKQQLEAEKAKNTSNETQIQQTAIKVEETKKENTCTKSDQLAQGLPTGMPVTYAYNPSNNSIKDYLDFYKQQAQETYDKNLPADTKFGNWKNSDGTEATVAEIKGAITFLENKYNEYLSLKSQCGS